MAGAIESVLAQTSPPAEILVCDDGSTDDTVAKAKSYPGVTAMELPHSGIVAVSRNRGIARASGEWVAFLDGDDQWEPEHLEHFLEVIGSTDAPKIELFSGNGTRVLPDGTTLPFFVYKYELPSGLVDVKDFLRVRPVITSTAIARRAAMVEEKGFPEDRSSVAAEDFDLWYRLLRRSGHYFDSRKHVRYLEHVQGLSLREGGHPSRESILYVLQRRLDEEDGPREQGLLREALANDHLTLALFRARDGQMGAALKSICNAFAMGLKPFGSVIARVLTGRVKRLYKTVFLMTVGASILVSLLGLARQKTLAGLIGSIGLADLSLILSIGTPLATLALWPMLSFAKGLNNKGNDDYPCNLKSAAVVCLAGYTAGALVAAIISVTTSALRYPLGERVGFVPALLFGLGMVGVGYGSAVLVYRGDLRLWGRLTLFTAFAQLATVAVATLLFDRAGAVWAMSASTALIGIYLLAKPLIVNRRARIAFPHQWIQVSLANGLVSMTLAGVESALRQGSVGLSVATGAYFQVSLSVIGALSAGVAQYSGGRLLPVATAARESEQTDHVWSEARSTLVIVAGFLVLVAGGMALLAPQLLTILFSSSFAEGSSLLRFVILGEGLAAIAVVVTTVVIGLGLTVHWAVICIVPALVRLVTFLTLVNFAPDVRLGWAYAIGGLAGVALAGYSYVTLSRRAG